MKKALLCAGLSAFLMLVQAIGFGVWNPGDVVNSSWDARLSPDKELKDQLLTVAIFMKISNNVYICTGTLVGDRSILTAKHCVADFLSGFERNFIDRPISTNDLKVLIYSPEALLPENQTKYGKVYKFWKDKDRYEIYEESTTYENLGKFDNIVPSFAYEKISVSSINPLRINADMALLTLSTVPQIVTHEIIHPLNEISFSSYKNFFTDAMKKYSEDEYLNGINENINDRRLFDSSNYIEIMGFGRPKIIEHLTDPQKQKIGFNLRSNSPSIPIFWPYPTNNNANNLCNYNCFVYSFVNQNADPGDSGGAVRYFQNHNRYPKTIIGITSRSFNFQSYSHGPLINMTSENPEDLLRYSIIIQGITENDAKKINQLRRLP